LTWVEFALQHFKVLDDVKSRHGISLVRLKKFLTKEALKELLEVHIYELATPLAAT